MSFPIVLTTAGLAAIVNAKNTGTASVEIASIGITQTAFTGTAATTVLPGEFARLSTFAGDVVADDTIHLTIRDEGASVYAMRGFGLYLASGALFATYGQAEAIVQKTAASIMLLAVDIKLAAGDATTVAFGNTNFLNPQATTERPGVIELATLAEAVAGLDPDRAISPATLKPIAEALLKLAGGQTVTGNVGFGGAAPIRPVTAQGEIVIRNPSASINFRNWNWVAAGSGKGTLYLRHLNEAADNTTQDFLSIDGETRVVGFAIAPTVAGNGVWHGGNLAVDTAALPGTVAKRTNDGSLQAAYLTVTPGSAIRNSFGAALFSPLDAAAHWTVRSTHDSYGGLFLQRKDGAGVGGMLANGDEVGLLNKSGTWRLRTDSNATGSLYNDAGVAYTLWTSANFDPTSKANALHSHDWGQVTGKPATYPPEAHSHSWDGITGKPGTFPPSGHGHAWGEISGKPATYPPDAHGHDWSQISGRPSSYPPDGHTHPWSQITGQPATYPPSGHGHSWNEISGKPSSYPPDPHGHDLAGLASSVMSMGIPGYIQVGPFILQWGITSYLAGDSQFNSTSFPISFPNACFGAVANPTVSSGTNSGASRYGWSITYWDQFRFEMINDSPASSYLFLAWGY